MYPNICHIYGPLYLNCYGLFIGLAIIIFNFLIQKNEKFNTIITTEKFNTVIILNIIIAAIGGRLLSIIQNWHHINSYYEVFAFWEPGYSFLGSLIAMLIFNPIYLSKIKVPILPLLDVTAIYGPLLHAIARIGCFFAGCCHGTATKLPWAIVYTHPDIAVPDKLKFIKIHPTQIYSFIMLLLIFFAMYYFFQKKFKMPGQLISIYLILGSFERFFNDFFRSDRNFYDNSIFKFFSLDQWISISICLFGTILFLQFTYKLQTSNNILIKKI